MLQAKPPPSYQFILLFWSFFWLLGQGLSQMNHHLTLCQPSLKEATYSSFVKVLEACFLVSQVP